VKAGGASPGAGLGATGLGGVGARAGVASPSAGLAVGLATGSAIVEVGGGVGDGASRAVAGGEGTPVGIGSESHAATKSKSEARIGTANRDIGESVALAATRASRSGEWGRRGTRRARRP